MIDLRRSDGDDNGREGAVGAVMFGVALDSCAEGVFEHFGEDIFQMDWYIAANDDQIG